MSFAPSSESGKAFTRLVILIAVTLVVIAGTSCGSSNAGFGTHPLTGNTNVTVLLSSTANDQLSQFDLVLQTLTLTGQSGKTVNLITADQPSETIHVNGGIEPMLTLSIPQDIYVSASATVGSAEFTCVTLTPPSSPGGGGLDESTYAYGYTPDSMVTVNIPTEITVTGDSMALKLDLQVLESASYSSCYPSGSFAITPTFNLTALTPSANPTNSNNGKALQIDGQVASIGTSGSTFTIAVDETGRTNTRTISISANSNTEYQGIANFSGLQVGTFVDLDGAVQADGSLLASRIAAYDTAALNVMTGPVLFTSNTTTAFYSFPRQQQGQDYTAQPFGLGIYSYANTTLFQISGQMSNLNSLPFVPTFNGPNMVPGQNVAIYSGPITAFSGGQTTTATTITLMPQMIDGGILSSATSGSFTVYTVGLAPDDLFPTLAVQPGQTTLLTSPNLVNVYVDANTQKVNTTALSAGNVLRFYGLVFNDNGTLRMDCAQISDGVPFSAPANANSRLQAAQAQVALRSGGGALPPVLTTLMRK